MLAGWGGNEISRDIREASRGSKQETLMNQCDAILQKRHLRSELYSGRSH